MRTKLFSPLMRGSGPDWSANFKWYEDPPGKTAASEPHCRYVIHERHLYRTVPKTFTTTKGAMMLYTSEDQVLKDKVSATLHSPVPPNDIKPSELDNLQKHILQFGTSAEDESCLKFTKPNTDDVYLDESTRPGSLPEVYLEDLRFKTKFHAKTNKMSVCRLKPTERIKSSHHSRSPSPASSALADSLQDPLSQPNSRPVSGSEKRKLLRPPSAAPPQPMPSVEKRKIEIIKDHQKHIDAANRREKLKYADFELVTTIPDHFKVKGLGGNEPKRRAYSSPVYHTKYSEENTYVTGDESKSLPLFVVTSSPSSRLSKPSNKHVSCQDINTRSVNSEVTDDSDKIDMGNDLHKNLQAVDAEEEQVSDMKTGIVLTSDVQLKSDSSNKAFHEKYADDGTKVAVEDNDDVSVTETGAHLVESGTVLEAGERKLGASDDTDDIIDCINADFLSESADRCPSSRQIIIDLPDENKEKPKESFISAELRLELETQRQDTVEEGSGEKLLEEEATITTTTMDQKSNEEISSTVDDLTGISGCLNRILTYPSFLSLSSANSKENQEDETPPQESEETDEELKREALLDAKNLVEDISRSKKGRKKRKGGKEGEKKKGSVGSGRSAKTKQSKQVAVPEPGPTTSDGEFRESKPPKSLVAMHRDTVESTSSITKKKANTSGSRKKRTAKPSDMHVAWDTQPPRSETVISDTEEVFSKSPHTMLLDDGNDEKINGPYAKKGKAGKAPLTPRQRKRLERPQRQQRTDNTDKSNESGVIELEAGLEQRKMSFNEVEEQDEEILERMRQEERERENRALELLERRIAVDDGSLKRLGEKVEIIEKKSIEQKDKEAALRQQGMMEELARKEDERKAYEEVMRAQEAEYERHLQNMLKQEEDRNRLYLDNIQKEEMQRDLKRKFAMFRQSQNLELRQHVRLSKLKQKFTLPFKYSYFPILKVDYMNIVTNREGPVPVKDNNSKNGKTKGSKKVSIKRI